MASSSSDSSQNIIRSYMPELDSVRGIAVLLVLFFHGFGFIYASDNVSRPAHWFVIATLPGWSGVNLFFVLSGFLITGILLDTRNHSGYFKTFYTRRALRILPAYYALLLILLIVPSTGLVAGRKTSWQFVSLSAIYLANMTELLGVVATYVALWSLAVEEHFYLLWPAIVRKFSRRAVMSAAATIIFVCPILRAVAYKMGSFGNAYTWLVADGLAMGALLATLLRGDRPQRKVAQWSALCAGMSGVLLFAFGYPYGIMRGSTLAGSVFRLSAVNLVFTAFLTIILLLGSSRHAWILNWQPLPFFGKISYGLYLIEMLAFDFVDGLIEKLFPTVNIHGHFSLICLRFLAASGIAIAVAYLSRKYFEERFLRLKDRWGSPQQPTVLTKTASFPVTEAESA